MSDFFAGIYDNAILNGTMIGIYCLGLLAGVVLCLVSWFEKSGQAGPFRTLVNQLSAIILDHLILCYIFGCGIDVLRIGIGPLPPFLCRSMSFVKAFMSLNAAIINLARTMAKFAFICIYKSIPVMNDNLLTFVITVIASVLSGSVTLAKFFYDMRPPMIEAICLGEWKDEYNEAQLSPFVAIILIFGILAHLGLTIPILVKKKNFNDSTPVVAFNHQNSPKTNLGTTFVSISTSIILSLLGGIFIVIENLSAESMTEWPYRFLPFLEFVILPFSLGIVLSLYFLLTKEHFRKAVKGVFWNDVLQQINE